MEREKEDLPVLEGDGGEGVADLDLLLSWIFFKERKVRDDMSVVFGVIGVTFFLSVFCLCFVFRLRYWCILLLSALCVCVSCMSVSAVRRSVEGNCVKSAAERPKVRAGCCRIVCHVK